MLYEDALLIGLYLEYSLMLSVVALISLVVLGCTSNNQKHIEHYKTTGFGIVCGWFWLIIALIALFETAHRLT